MAKKFNFRGTCLPGKHYMVDTTAKIGPIVSAVEDGEYITIHYPRQFGKTTTLLLLERELEKRNYLPIPLSFEGIGEVVFSKEAFFVKTFGELIAEALELQNDQLAQFLLTESEKINTLRELSRLITRLVKKAGPKLVLLIDEVDKSSNNQLFLSFLGMLREKYLRRGAGKDFTFLSVILAGVHDIKSLKLKITSGSEIHYNSPWNIALDLPVDLSFAPGEIATMLTDYSEDKKVQMDIPAVSERLHYYTSGYPFLVSRLCYMIDDTIMRESRWLPTDVDEAVKLLLPEGNTNFDHLVKNLEANKELYEFVERIILKNEDITVVKSDPLIALAITYGIIKDKTPGSCRVHNRIYGQLIYDLMTRKFNRRQKDLKASDYNFKSNFISEDGSLDFEKILMRFQAFLKEQYSRNDQKFIEQNGRLLFLSFLKPIINGKGLDLKEVQISEEKRIDIMVLYGPYKYIVELKIWKGDKAHEKGIGQLTDYLERQESSVGFLLIFNFNQNKEWKTERITSGGKDIFAVWV